MPNAAFRQAADDIEARLRAVFDAAIDAIMTIDDRGIVRSLNRSAERMFGYPDAEIIGQNIRVLMPEPFSSEHDGYIARYLATGEKHIIGLGREAIARRKDGSTFPIELAVSEGVVDSPHRFTGIVRDISARREAAEEKERMRKDFEAKFLRAQRLESIGTLVSGIAHDLNNVMMPILMAVRLLKKDIHEGRQREMLDTAEASVERGTLMIRQLLTFAGGVEGERRPVVVGDLVTEVRSMLDHSLPKSIHVVTELPPRPWTVLGDATQLSQVLLNLCVNARDAMPAGGTLTIHIDHRLMNGNLTSLYPEAKPGAYILLSVTDTGSGIPAHVKERIFDPFFTTKPQGQGTGLGLSTVVGIVKSHGGFVNLYSEEGRGTKMTVYLPAHDAPAANRPEVPHPLTGATGELILLIDDEPAIRSMTRAALEDHGFQVLTAAEGSEGINLFRQNSGTIRAVLVDMMMPGVDGPQVMAELRRDWPTIPIVAASGLKPTGATARAIEDFASTFLLKPFSDDDLVRTLNRLLGKGSDSPVSGTGTMLNRG